LENFIQKKKAKLVEFTLGEKDSKIISISLDKKMAKIPQKKTH